MFFMENKSLKKVIAAIVAPLLLVGVAFCVTQNNNLFKRVSASGPIATFDSSNTPTLDHGEATVEDYRGITWEYHNASYYSGGHISLSNEGYFGISSVSSYGLKGVTGVTANFNANGDSELWLLKSVNGIDWGEDALMESGTTVETANNWQYLRFYCYSSTSVTVDINLVQITYSCDSISPTEDVDSAKASNVISTTDNMTYAAEYNDLSPNSKGTGEAVSFTKSSGGKSEITFGFGQTYVIGNIQNCKIEFDMKTSNINYGKTIQLMNGNATFGSATDSSKHSAYKCTNIEDDWYHIEVPITSLISTISGYNGKDKPVSNVEKKEINGIKINAGTCVIDNLRIDSSSCELGIYNNPTYVAKVGEKFWVKVSWVGKLYPDQVSMSISDAALAKRVPLDDPNLMNGSPFYIELLAPGTLTVTCTVVSCYNRQSQTIQHTISIK